MKEYGGYIEFENYSGPLFHDKAIALNCGRNALAYIIEAKNIKKLYIPYFICSSVVDVCKKNGVNIQFYNINEKFEPVFCKKLNDEEYIYVVNYYGQLDDDYILRLKEKWERIIVDNSQSFYNKPLDSIDTLYTCRKFFGVSDGAYLYTNKKIKRKLPIDQSYDRMKYLMGRYERTANEFYMEYVSNNKMFNSEPIKCMSKLTRNILRSLDYDNIAKKRQNNFNMYNKKLETINKLKLKSVYGAFMYPLLIKQGKLLRRKLQEMNIYIPTLWPDVLERCSEETLEYNYAENILPLPVDQRYDIEDIEYIISKILNEINTYQNYY